VIRSLARRFAGPVAWLSLAELLARLGNLGIQLVLIRALAPGVFGRLAYAFSLFSLLVPALSLGLPEAFVREGSVSRERLPGVLTEYFSLRVFSAGGALALAALLAGLHGSDFAILFAVAAYVVFRSMTQFLALSFRAAEIFSREFALRAGESLFLLLVAAGASHATGSLPSITVSLAAGAAAYLGGTLLAFRSLHPGFAWRFPSSAAQKVVLAMPLGLPLLLPSLLLRADVVLYRIWTGDLPTTGYYAAAANVVLGAALLPALMVGAVFPALSRHNRELRSRPALLISGTAGFLVLGAALAGGLSLFAVPVARIVCGPGYGPAGPLLSALSPFLLFLSPALFVSAFLAAAEDRRSLLLCSGATLAFKLAGNLWAIPFRGPTGMAAFSAGAEFLCLILALPLALRGRPSS
jgi:O-antigen/teichoic acid export membrane protein